MVPITEIQPAPPAGNGTGGAPAGLSAVPTGAEDELHGLVPALGELLSGALGAAEARFGADAAADPFRGLYLVGEEVARGLRERPGEPAFPPSGAAVDRLGDATERLRRLGALFDLTAFDRAVVALALAPSVDARYGRLYAYLQDDVTRVRPSVGLVQDLLCRDREERRRSRSRFSAGAPLVGPGLVTLSPERSGAGASLSDLDLHLAPPVEGFLLGTAGPDPRLAAVLLPPAAPDEPPTLSPVKRREMEAMARSTLAAGRPLRLFFEGSAGHGQHAAAAELVRRLDAPLLALDVDGLRARDADEADRLLAGVLLEARLRRSVVFLRDAGAGNGDQGRPDRLLPALARHPGPLVLAGARTWRAAEALPELVTIPFGPPSLRRRRASWRRGMARAGVEDGPRRRILESELAERFELAPRQVDVAAAEAVASGAADGADGVAGGGLPLRSRLYAAARARSGQGLQAHARRLEPSFGWEDLVLPGDARRQLEELCQRVRHRHRVLEEWGLGARLALGSGVAALFAGPSGTGKTMAARVVAGDLGLDLYRIDLSQVVSKYIGETEKNLGRIFDLASTSNAILFFDEADALFGKRSEVKDAHDRYANIEVGYLLQKMEEHTGVTILATNLRNNLDDAFVRRLAFHVHFPMPGEGERRRIWEGVLPDGVPMADDVDRGFLAGRFKVSGGNIRNAAVAAAFLAAEDGGAVAMRHLVQGLRREFQKMGKACVASDFGRWFEVLDPEDGA